MAKGIDKKLDDAWSEAVKVRDNYTCQYCGKQTTLNSHHIFSRSNKSTRWDIGNGITLCVSHHTFNSKFSAHKTPTEFTYWLEERMGRYWVENLSFRAKQTAKYYKADKEQMLEDLKNYIDENSK